MISFLFTLLAAPAVDPSVITAAETFSRWPVTIAFGLLLLSVLGFCIWYVTKAWPAQQESTERRIATAVAQGEQTRRFLDEMLQKRGAEAAASEKLIVDTIAADVKDVARSIDDVHGRMSAVHDRVSAVHDKVDTVHGLVKLLAQKGGVGLLLFFTFGAGAASLHLGSRAYAAWRGPRLDTTLSADCSAIGGCKSPEYCCQKDTCCRNANATTDTTLCACKPTSNYVWYVDYGSDPFAARNARERQL